MRQQQRPQGQHHERAALLAPAPHLDLYEPPSIAKTTLRQDFWTVLRFRSSVTTRSGLQLASYALELSILVLILLNVVFAISESTVAIKSSEPVSRSTWTGMFLLTSTVIFSVEYALRLWSCVEDTRYRGAVIGRLRWMAQPLSLLDLIALAPFYLEICFQLILIPSYTGALILRSLRLLRVIAFLRLERSYSAIQNVRMVFSRKREELLVVTYLTLVILLTSSTTIFFLENPAQPHKFSSIGTCAWWSIETITSLGYGDIVPTTNAGRVFGAALAVCGIVLFTVPGAVLGSGFIEVMLEKQRSDESAELRRAVQEEEEEEETHEETQASQAVDEKPRFGAGRDADGSLRIELPDAAALPTRAGSFRRLSPSVATALKLQQLAHKMDAVAVAQRQLQQQIDEQQQAFARMTAALEALAPGAAATSDACH